MEKQLLNGGDLLKDKEIAERFLENVNMYDIFVLDIFFVSLIVIV